MKLKKAWNLFKQDIRKDLKYGIKHLEKREQMAAIILGFVLIFTVFYLFYALPVCPGCPI